jgi:type II secretory pathway pseudopilin PulG
MSRSRCPLRAFILVELLVAIAVSMVIIAVLGKLLLDGMYLQRIAWERTSRNAVADALADRLRADALGAAGHNWIADDCGLTLNLLTCAAGSPQNVEWRFAPESVVRRVEHREAGSFEAERLRFAARIEPNERADLLLLDLIVSPPERARYARPRIWSQCVFLPRPPAAPVTSPSELQP